MKKILKTLAIAIVALAAVFACAFAAGCTGSGNSGTSTSDYNFTIVDANGNAINGQTGGANGGKVNTQLCIDEICLPLALQNIYPDENGKLSLSQKQVNELFATAMTVTGDITKFDFHVINYPGHAEDCMTAVNGKGDYTLKLTK